MLSVTSFEAGTSYSAQSVPYMEGNALCCCKDSANLCIVGIFLGGIMLAISWSAFKHENLTCKFFTILVYTQTALRSTTLFCSHSQSLTAIVASNMQTLVSFSNVFVFHHHMTVVTYVCTGGLNVRMGSDLPQNLNLQVS